MNKPEILAPAGSYEALEAAVRCGADAVYLGQKSFSARAHSQNFDPGELKAAAAYAHRYGVKIHQALNTLVFDGEIPKLVSCIEAACMAGVDAFIVQDLGVAALARRYAPEMPLHASTQMAIHSPAGAETAEALGFSRLVLARELSREEIAAIRGSTGLEIEVFVHGAHCMSISGQCYMSAVFGGKSGNRGQCAQPCRLPFSCAVPGGGRGSQEEYALSLKDMSLVTRLPGLAAMGVDSVKIEGRMKRPEYVAAAVTACKKALAGEAPDMEALQAVFSRSGFTSAYFDGEITGKMFGFRRKEDVAAAGGVLKALAGLYHKDTPRIPVKMELVMERGKPAQLAVSDGEHVAAVLGEIPREASGAPADGGQARKFLGKLGGTPYILTRFSGEIGEGLALSAAAFNAMRREAAEKLDALRAPRPIPFAPGPLPKLPEREAPGTAPKNHFSQRRASEKWGKFAAFAQASPEILAQADRLLLPVEEIGANWEKLSPWREKLTAVPPRFSFYGKEEALSQSLAALKAMGVESLFCENISHIRLARQAGLAPFGGPFLNLANSYSLNEAEKLGLEAAVCSIELKVDAARRLKGVLPLGMQIYGRFPLMAVRSCPVKARLGCEKCKRQGALVDRKGLSFPVRCDRDKQVSLIYNPLPLELSDRLEEFSFLDFWLLDFTLETPETVRAVWERYAKGGKPEGSYTRGLYYRGVE